MSKEINHDVTRRKRRTGKVGWMAAGGALFVGLVIAPIFALWPAADGETPDAAAKTMRDANVLDMELTEPSVTVAPEDGPRERSRSLGLDAVPKGLTGIEGPHMQPARPPQGTDPLAMPLLDPEPPDPFTAPPIEVDPERQPAEKDGARRRSIDD